MLWFAVWTTLVLATLVGAFLLGRRLWRSVKALMAQLRETSDVLEQLQVRIEELEALRGPEPVFRPTLLATEDERQRWRAVRLENRERRAARRDRRRAATYERWHRLGLPGMRPAPPAAAAQPPRMT